MREIVDQGECPSPGFIPAWMAKGLEDRTLALEAGTASATTAQAAQVLGHHYRSENHVMSDYLKQRPYLLRLLAFVEIMAQLQPPKEKVK